MDPKSHLLPGRSAKMGKALWKMLSWFLLSETYTCHRIQAFHGEVATVLDIYLKGNWHP